MDERSTFELLTQLKEEAARYQAMIHEKHAANARLRQEIGDLRAEAQLVGDSTAEIAQKAAVAKENVRTLLMQEEWARNEREVLTRETDGLRAKLASRQRQLTARQAADARTHLDGSRTLMAAIEAQRRRLASHSPALERQKVSLTVLENEAAHLAATERLAVLDLLADGAHVMDSS